MIIGSGHIMDMVGRMKANSNLLKKPRFKDLRKMYLKNWNVQLTSTKRLSEKELALIRKRIKKRQIKINAIRIVVFLLLIAALFLFFIFILIAARN